MHRRIVPPLPRLNTPDTGTRLEAPLPKLAGEAEGARISVNSKTAQDEAALPPTRRVGMPTSSETLQVNKAAVVRFNKEVIEQGDEGAFGDLMAPDFVNRTAPPGAPPGAAGMWMTFTQVLRPAFPDLRVVIHDQIAEGDKVTTRKTIHGTHRGELLGIPATNQRVAIEVIDIVRLENGRYVEHWGVNTLATVLASLLESA